jgi:DNA polymerase-3 subunit gamma/tau
LAYISLYRKWRPQTFEEVIGQEYVTRTLGNSLRSGNFAHAYLFAGPRGTGKTSTARILAKALNCEEGPTPNPCNRCASCRAITEGTSVDVIEIDAASNRGIDDIRDLRERVIFSPAAARMKVYILDEAHMITIQAFNALLKMLEEPPAHVVFVLATTEPHKMPPTILSRCQRFDFRSVPVSRLAQHLARVSEEEGAQASEGALRLIARRARGSARDALVILEQVISYGDGVVDEAEAAGFLGLIEDEMLVQLGDYLAGGDTAGTINLVERAYEEGRDLVQFARGAQEHFRRVFLLQYADLSPEDLEVDEGAYRSIRRQAEALPPDRTFHFINALREAVKEMQATSSPRLVLEGALIGMARSELDASPEALAVRLEKLEGEMERLIRKRGGEAAPAQAAPAPRAWRETREEPAGGEVPEGEEEPEIEEEEHPGGAEAAGGLDSEKTVAKDIARPAVAAPATIPVDLATVRRAWPQIKDRVKDKKITTHAFLLEGKPQEVRGGELVISFPPDRSFHRGEMDKEDHRRVLEEALEEVLGVELKVRSGIEEEPRRGSVGKDKGPKERKQPRRRTAKANGQEKDGDPEARPVGQAAGEAGPESAPGDVPEPPEEAKPEPAEKTSTETHDAGKVKLVKDVFGAEIIEEIKLNE